MNRLAVSLVTVAAVTCTVAQPAQARQLSQFEIWLITTLTGLPELKEILELQNDPDVQALGGLHPELQAAFDKLGDKVVKQIKDRLDTENLPSLTLDTEEISAAIGLNEITADAFSKSLQEKLGTEGLGEALGKEFTINPDKILEGIGGENLGDKAKDHLKDYFEVGPLEGLKPDADKLKENLGADKLGEGLNDRITDKLGTDTLGEDINKAFPFDEDAFKKKTGIEALEKMSSANKDEDDAKAKQQELTTQLIIGFVGSIGVLALLAHIIRITPGMLDIARSMLPR